MPRLRRGSARGLRRPARLLRRRAFFARSSPSPRPASRAFFAAVRLRSPASLPRRRRRCFAIATLSLRHDLRNVRDLQDQVAQRRHQRQPRGAQLLVLRHHQHVVEELRHRRLQRGDRRRTPRDSRRAAAAARIAGARCVERRPAAPARPAPSAATRSAPASAGAATPLVMFFTRLSSAATPSSASRAAHLRQRLELAPRLERADVARCRRASPRARCARRSRAARAGTPAGRP